jgi:hypothetical protein
MPPKTGLPSELEDYLITSFSNVGRESELLKNGHVFLFYSQNQCSSAKTF